MIVLACDLGGTRMKIGVVRDGCVLTKTIKPAQSKNGIARIACAQENLAATAARTQSQAEGLCRNLCRVPQPGRYRGRRVLAEYGKFADAMALNLRAWSQTELRLPLAIENDARMALIGEWKSGAGAE